MFYFSSFLPREPPITEVPVQTGGQETADIENNEWLHDLELWPSLSDWRASWCTGRMICMAEMLGEETPVNFPPCHLTDYGACICFNCWAYCAFLFHMVLHMFLSLLNVLHYISYILLLFFPFFKCRIKQNMPPVGKPTTQHS